MELPYSGSSSFLLYTGLLLKKRGASGSSLLRIPGQGRPEKCLVKGLLGGLQPSPLGASGVEKRVGGLGTQRLQGYTLNLIRVPMII